MATDPHREEAHALLKAIGLSNPEDWSCMVARDGLWQHGERCLRVSTALSRAADVREAEMWLRAAEQLGHGGADERVCRALEARAREAEARAKGKGEL